VDGRFRHIERVRNSARRAIKSYQHRKSNISFLGECSTAILYNQKCTLQEQPRYHKEQRDQDAAAVEHIPEKIASWGGHRPPSASPLTKRGIEGGRVRNQRMET
jgi:hypothetical protein